MALVTLTTLDGASVRVESSNVTSLQPIPSALLPGGIPNGTAVETTDGGVRSTVNAQGTVAAVAALLGGNSNFAFVSFDAVGAIITERGVTSVVRNAAGVFTVVFDAAVSGGVASANYGAVPANDPGWANVNQTGGSTLQVYCYRQTIAAPPVFTQDDPDATFLIAFPVT